MFQFKIPILILAVGIFFKYEILMYKPEKDYKTPEYLDEVKPIQFDYSKTINFDKNCKNNHKMCSEWALVGECESNPNFMLNKCQESCRVCQSERCHDKIVDCAKRIEEYGCYKNNMKDDCQWSCSSCDALKNIKKCVRNPKHKASISENSTNYLFNNLIKQYSAVSHSSETWIITIDDVINEEDCDNIIKSINTEQWSPSLVGDGKLPARTSSTHWCESSLCRENTKKLREWVNDKMKISDEYAEPLQILRYNKEEYYKPHHDQNSPRSSAWGPRIYTVFFYLSDVEEGGETNFPTVNVTIKPKKGSVLIWSNILNEDLNKRDEKTSHQSLPVIKGTKFSANYWIHLYPYKLYNGCGNNAYYENWY